MAATLDEPADAAAAKAFFFLSILTGSPKIFLELSRSYNSHARDG